MSGDHRRAFLDAVQGFTGERELWPEPPGTDPLAALKQHAASDAAGAGAGAPADAGVEDIVVTERMRSDLAVISCWLHRGEPFVVCGPAGCGKSTLLRRALAELPGTRVAEMSCSAQTLADHVVQKLLQVCGKPVLKGDRKVLRPRDSRSLVLLLRDINLPRPDAYNTVQMIAFLQQCIVHGGFYDSNLDFIHIEGIQIVGTMMPPGSMGAQPVSTRFTGVVRILVMETPDPAELCQIFTGRAHEVLAHSGPQNAAWRSSGGVARLADTMLTFMKEYQDLFKADRHAHYAVNACDMASWFAAVARYDWADASVTVADAVTHEALRIFRDRLVGDEHRAAFDGLMGRCLLPQLKQRAVLTDAVFSTLGASADDRLRGTPAAQKLCKWPLADFRELVADRLRRYERDHRALSMQLFPESLHLVARLDRALARPGGALLLNGPCGAGRRSTLHLVAYAHHMPVRSPPCTPGLGLKPFCTFLKEVLRTAGVAGEPVCLLLEDHHIVDPAFLEYVNSLLTAGEVPGLFTQDELDKELAPLDTVKADVGRTDMNMYQFFVERVKQNLRTVVSLDPKNAAYGDRLASNPALLSRTEVQWLSGWSADAQDAICAAVCEPVMSESDVMAPLPGWLRAAFDVAAARGLATPRHFITLAHQYVGVFQRKHDDLQAQISFLKGGLAKLAEAEGVVDTLSTEAEEQRGKLQSAQAEVDAAMAAIEVAMQEAASRKAEVERLSVQQTEEQAKVADRKDQVEDELQNVQPLIDKARRAVGNLKADNLNEIRSLKAPPAAIRDVLEAVLRVMGQTDTSWNAMKKFLAGTGVKDRIINFDATAVTPEMRSAVKRLITEKGDSFEPERIKRVSVAAAPMAEWVLANLRYSEVLQAIAPLTRELAGLEESMERGAARLAQCEDEVGELERRKSELQRDFGAKNEEATVLKINLRKAESTLSAASNLLSKLSGEKGSWSEQASSLQAQLAALPKEAVVFSAFCTFAGAQPEEARAAMLREWHSALSLDATVDVRSFVTTERDLLQWKAAGLPGDQLSSENAAILQGCWRVPLLIDPGTSASSWYRDHLAAAGGALEVTTLHDVRFTTALELAVRFGKVLLIQEVDSVPPILVNLLRQDFEVEGLGQAVVIGDKRVDYNKAFRLVLTTRNPAISLPPDVAPLLTVTNFTVTRSGLETQLLSATIQHEQPELEAQRSALLEKEESMKVELAELNKALLSTLASSQGNLLENTALVASLDDTKSKALEIASALEASRAVQRDLDAKRQAYAPLSQLAARMYFVLCDLPELNHMYRFSLAAFTRLFSAALAGSAKSSDVAIRIASAVPRGGQAMFPQFEWDYFMNPPVSHGAAAAGGAPNWVPEALTARYQALADALPGLAQAANLQDNGLWASWMQQPDAEKLPPAAAQAVSPLQATILVQTFRPDRLQSSLTHLAQGLLGLSALAPGAATMKALHEASDARTPVLFLTTPGGDPSQELLAYAHQSIGAARYHEVAMGQGQTDRALELLHSCAASGEWLCLKNAHLVASWLPRLEQAVHGLSPAAGFRLWLTTEPHGRFPATLLEGALKAAFEAPPGLKRNVQRSLVGVAGGAGAAGVRGQLLTLLAWFHGVVQERRTYIPQGWSKFYEFSGADLSSGAQVIANATEGNRGLQWQQLLGLLENAIYGGRVDNPSDLAVLRTYLRLFFCQQMLDGQATLLGTEEHIASSGSGSEARAMVDRLPDTNTPALFGLAANIDRTVQETASAAVIAQLRRLGLRQLSAGGFDRDLWRAQLSPLLRCWRGLTADGKVLTHATQTLRSKPGGGRDDDPLHAFLLLEAQQAARLVTAIDASLAAIHAAVSAGGALSVVTASEGKILLKGSVPAAWDTVWEGPTNVMAYVKGVVTRAVALRRLTDAHAGGALLAGTVPLTAFFNPGMFLNTVRQLCARAAGVSMDTLVLSNGWSAEEFGGECPVPVAVTGLVIEGARCAGSHAEAVSASSPRVEKLQPVVFAWLLEGAAQRRRANSRGRLVQIPVYTDADRTRKIVDIHLQVASEQAVDKLVLSGAAVFQDV